METLPHVVLTDGNTEWNPTSVEMTSKRPYGDNAHTTWQAVRRKNLTRAQARPVEHESDLVLGAISGSFVADDAYERMVLSMRVR